jgi:cysteine desulfurase / selenocysteine lyase
MRANRSGRCRSTSETSVCDFLSTTGRKFLRGPRGTGFLYVSSARLDQLTPAQPEVGSASWTADDAFTYKPGAKRFERWEVSYALELGLGAAIDYALSHNLEEIWRRDEELAESLREVLNEIPGVTTYVPAKGSVRS